jgi:hypothetical protein
MVIVERFEEFIIGTRNFMFIDFSGFKNVDDFNKLIGLLKPAIAKYPLNTLNTITNLENVRIDTDFKEIAIEYMAHNKPYVKYGVIIGIDGIKKIMANTVIKLSGRKNMFFTFTKEQAVEWILGQK